MAEYVDGFVIPVPKKNIEEYRRISRKAGKIWMEHGALSYREAAGDDLKINFGTPFPALCKLKPNETVMFAWITYKSRKHRDKVNAAVMTDPRMQGMEKTMPFDIKRMSFGGFEAIVNYNQDK